MTLERALGVVVLLLPLVAGGREPGEGTIEVSGASALSFASMSAESTFRQPGFPDSTSDSKVRNLNASGGILYYLTPVAGIGLELAWSSDETSSGSYRRAASSVAIAPKLGGEVTLSDDSSLFGDVRLGLQTTSTETTGSTTVPNGRVTFSGIRYGLRAGVKWFPVDDVSLNVGAEYLVTRLSADLGGGVEQENRNRTLRAIAGVSIYFGR